MVTACFLGGPVAIYALTLLLFLVGLAESSAV